MGHYYPKPAKEAGKSSPTLETPLGSFGNQDRARTPECSPKCEIFARARKRYLDKAEFVDLLNREEHSQEDKLKLFRLADCLIDSYPDASVVMRKYQDKLLLHAGLVINEVRYNSKYFSALPESEQFREITSYDSLLAYITALEKGLLPASLDDYERCTQLLERMKRIANLSIHDEF